MSKTSPVKTAITIVSCCLTMLLLQGCGNKVDCNSGKTKDNAMEIIQSNLNAQLWYRQIGAALSGSPELVNIKTSSRNDELKQAECSATYSYTYNGKPREVDVGYTLAYLQDKGEVEVKVYMQNLVGGMATIVMHESPIKNGTEKIIDPRTGNLQHTIEWKNGVQDGEEKYYNPANNKVIGEINYTNGQKTGSQKSWNADRSTLLVDIDWVDGKANGTEKQLDPTGSNLITDLTWKDGKQTGVVTVMRPGYNQISEESHFKDGLLDGVHKRYAPTGVGPTDVALVLVENYKQGKLDGLSQSYSENGQADAPRQYKDGVELPPSPDPQPASPANQTLVPAPETQATK